jgi:hypothetical protein
MRVIKVHMYFFGWTWTRPLLTYTRNVQLLGGILWDVWIIRLKSIKGESTTGNNIAELLLICYLILHRRDVRMMAERKGEGGQG